ncbi:MAG: hypothetical protein ABI925_03085 [Verrucomicrobiota bacterium]
MKTFLAGCSIAFAFLSLSGCGLWQKHSPPPQPAAAASEPVQTADPAATPKPRAQTETLTGKVVLVQAGYRLKLVDDESGTLFRMTQAKRTQEFVAEQINLRKYYEKTIVVRGKREEDWIWSAEVIGQWLKPGESRGANRLAPPVSNR